MLWGLWVVGPVVAQNDVMDWVPLATSELCVRWQELRLWVVGSVVRMGLATWWMPSKTFGLYVGWWNQIGDSLCGLWVRFLGGVWVA